MDIGFRSRSSGIRALHPRGFTPASLFWTPGKVEYTPHAALGQPRSTPFGNAGLPNWWQGCILPLAGAVSAECRGCRKRVLTH